MLNSILNWLFGTWSHWPENKHLETYILHAFWGGGAEVAYYRSDQRGIMVILRRARPPASAPTSNESWLALAGFVSNQLSGGQFNKEKLSSQPARNTACKYVLERLMLHRTFFLSVSRWLTFVFLLTQIVNRHGPEADRHLLRCLFSHVDFSGDGKSSGKDFHQVRLENWRF